MSARRPRVAPRSIRFRLTAWHAVVVAASLAIFGVGISAALAYDLRRDLDARLSDNALQVFLQVDQAPTVGAATRYLDLYALTGPYTEIRDAAGAVVYASDALGGRELATPAPAPGDAFYQVGILGTTLRGRYATVEIDGERLRVVVVTMTRDGLPLGEIRVAESLAEIDRTLATLRRALLLAALLALAVAVAGGWLLAGRALRPVERMRAEAAGLATTCAPGAPLAARLEAPATDDEIARLAGTFNQLLDRLETAFAAERHFTADASHELRTPLTAMRGNVDVLLRQARATGADADTLDALADIQREAARMSRLLEDLLTLARADAGSAPPPAGAVDLHEVASLALRTARGLDRDRPLVLAAADPPPGPIVRGDADRLEQAMLVLLDNAIRHSPAGAPVRLELAREGREAVIRVVDAGEGIPPEHLPRIFDRFYRVDVARDRASGGSGLGLAIAQAIVRQHGGAIAATSEVGAGSTFTIRLPLA